jgi:hypothetical protein
VNYHKVQSSLGECPVHRLKAFEKTLYSENPKRKAISSSLMRDFLPEALRVIKSNL